MTCVNCGGTIKKVGETARLLKRNTASNAGPSGDGERSSNTIGFLSTTLTCAPTIMAAFISAGESSGN